MRWLLVALMVLAAGCADRTPPAAPEPPAEEETPEPPTPVVVATFDTGTNPFHPCFRRPGADPLAERALPNGTEVRPLQLTFADDYATSLEASQGALDAIEPDALYHVQGTRLLFRGAPAELVDDYPHGAQASSQIVCEDYGLAPDAWLLVQNWYDDRSGNVARLAWVAQQPWVDVVHLNIQDTPTPLGVDETDAIRALVATGKLVVLAGGNGVAGGGASYPMELSSYNGPVGSLVAGAIDNEGGTSFSNLDPHVAMDGCGTSAAAPDGFGEATFGGTSSASPRTTGYAARLLWEVRNATGAVRAPGALAALGNGTGPPAEGPLSDGVLTAAELHEAIRKTADPREHDSAFDGEACPDSIPADPGQGDRSFYAKMGYGEVSEHTLPGALAVLLGEAPMPARPNEDMWFEQSEALRRQLWE